jgi:metal-sulfur cluster biosynthetic enzyme
MPMNQQEVITTVTEALRDQVHGTLRGLELPVTICANWVWKPMWGPEHITEDGKDQLRAPGYHI